jgi:activating signal cointegrator 1
MRALSVHQPWPGLIAAGLKTLEIRSWTVKYRGPIVIHATRRQPGTETRLILDRGYVTQADLDDPLCKLHGRLVCLVELVDCRRFSREDDDAARCDWRPDMWAWVLAEPQLVVPVPMRGRQGLWNVARVEPLV